MAEQFSLSRTKEDPGAEQGPGSVAGWVRGWGLGGTPPGVGYLTPDRNGGSCPAKLFSSCGPAAASVCPRTGSLRQIRRQVDREIHLAPIGKFQITRMDAKAPFAPAATLDDVAGTHRKSAREAICERTHDNPPGEDPRQGHQCQINATVPRHRGKCRGLLWIAVDRPSNDLFGGRPTIPSDQGVSLKRRNRCPAPGP
jgi:hypothetical protein